MYGEGAMYNNIHPPICITHLLGLLSKLYTLLFCTFTFVFLGVLVRQGTSSQYQYCNLDLVI